MILNKPFIDIIIKIRFFCHICKKGYSTLFVRFQKFPIQKKYCCMYKLKTFFLFLLKILVEGHPQRRTRF